MRVSIAQLRDAYDDLDYRLFDGEFDLNLIGIRSTDTHANTFNDLFCVLYKRDGNWQLEQFACTTDPGTFYRENPINVRGTAIVAPGQHRSVWTFGKHQGKYDALVQNKAITVYRDNNNDALIDLNTAQETGFFGINCHHAGANSDGESLVDRWSAGCQVLANISDFERVIELCNESAKQYGKTFTYTLFTQQQIEK